MCVCMQEAQHRQDIVEMQDLSVEKEHLLMSLMQESEEDHQLVLGACVCVCVCMRACVLMCVFVYV